MSNIGLIFFLCHFTKISLASSIKMYTYILGKEANTYCSKRNLSWLYLDEISNRTIIEMKKWNAAATHYYICIQSCRVNGILKFPSDNTCVYALIHFRKYSKICNTTKCDRHMDILCKRRESTDDWEDFNRLPVCTVRTALVRFLDITTPPSMEFLKLLALQSGNRKDIALLENLSNDHQAYEEWKLVKDPNILELLTGFPSLRVDPTLLLTQLPILHQRYYSISSSPKAYPREIHATIAVLKYNTMGGTGSEHQGVCSSWLNACEIGENIPCAIREAPLFHLPEDPTLPVVMVGTGTGIAPFRSFWQQRQMDRETLPSPFGNTKRWGDMDIYFGCRQSATDNIYGQELDVCRNEKVFSEVNIALSREPGVKKTYVQDLILKNEDKIYHQIMRKGGHFYVCGDVIMASEVESTLEQILQRKGNMSTEDAAKCLSELKANNSFHQDIFGVNLKSKEEQAQKILAKSSAENRDSLEKSSYTTTESAVCVIL